MRRTALAGAGLVAIAAGLLPATSAAGPTRAHAATTAPKRWVVGYYAIYQRSMLSASAIDWKSLTHLVVAAVIPRSNGSLDTSYYDTPSQGPKLATALTRAATKHHVVPILMVGGAGAHDAFAAAAKNHQATLVNNLVSVMHREGFAGLDLDWEPVATSDQPVIGSLVDALRTRLPNAVLTMPVVVVTTTFPKVSPFYGTIAKKLDRIDVMTYGMAGAYPGWKTWHSSALGGAGPSTPADVVVNVKSYEAAGVPAAKLGIGIGFYGSCWAGGVTGPRQKIGSSYIAAHDNVMTYPRIMSSYYSASAYHYDTKANAPYLGFHHATGPQNCTFISYENPRSVTAKGTYAEAHHLGAEIIWTINQGHVKTGPVGKRDALLDAVHHSFH